MYALCSYFDESEVMKMPAKVLASTENMPYADWLELRKQGIGGSDASVVCSCFEERKVCHARKSSDLY